MPSSNPTASTDMGRDETGTFKIPSVLTTRATRKTTRFSVSDAKSNARPLWRFSLDLRDQ